VERCGTALLHGSAGVGMNDRSNMTLQQTVGFAARC
jgi:hypothetical protein